MNDSDFTNLPDKEEGQHRWVVVASYILSAPQMGAARAGAKIVLDDSNRMSIVAGCIDCETDVDEAWGTSCKAEAYIP